MIEAIKPALPAGHKWRKDYVLVLSPGTYKSRVHSGYFSRITARRDARSLVKEGSAREVHVVRYSEGAVSIRAHVVEIVKVDA